MHNYLSLLYLPLEKKLKKPPYYNFYSLNPYNPLHGGHNYTIFETFGQKCKKPPKIVQKHVFGLPRVNLPSFYKSQITSISPLRKTPSK